MKKILVLGAGQSTPYLISYLLENAIKYNWFITVCDYKVENAVNAIDNHEKGIAVELDIKDTQMRNSLIEKSDIVVNMLSPDYQYMVAMDCLHFGKHCVTASYTSSRVAELDKSAMGKGIIILNEMGLDPGIDHMSAMSLIQKVRNDGGRIESFISYGSALPAPEVKSNPLQYCITWNPRNITMAGLNGAQYMEDSKIKLLAYHQVFRRTWGVDIEGLGELEAYPNRDSLVYRDLFDLKYVHTMIRATLRYPGWCETWLELVKLGYPNETMNIPNLYSRTYAELTEMFIPLNISGKKLETRVANFLNISPTGKIMDNLKWLGLFSDEMIGHDYETSAEVLTAILIDKLPLPSDSRDMVILKHSVGAFYPKKNTRKNFESIMVDYGEKGKYTAIAKSVGAPAAIAVKIILNNQLPLTGCHIPTHPVIYKTILEELKELGIEFQEKVEEIK